MRDDVEGRGVEGFNEVIGGGGGGIGDRLIGADKGRGSRYSNVWGRRSTTYVVLRPSIMQCHRPRPPTQLLITQHCPRTYG